jgi:hypothetical protein
MLNRRKKLKILKMKLNSFMRIWASQIFLIDTSPALSSIIEYISIFLTMITIRYNYSPNN